MNSTVIFHAPCIQSYSIIYVSYAGLRFYLLFFPLVYPDMNILSSFTHMTFFHGTQKKKFCAGGLLNVNASVSIAWKRAEKQVSTFLLLCSIKTKESLECLECNFSFLKWPFNVMVFTLYCLSFLSSHREEMLVVLDEHQGEGDDSSAVFYAQSLRAELSLWSSLFLQEIGPKDHCQVCCRHLITWDLITTPI